MCEFCLKHGEGEKWYLQAKNYSEDLLSDLRRLKFLEQLARFNALPREIRVRSPLLEVRLTKQEIRDEMKDSDGNPQIKQQIRRLQRDAAPLDAMRPALTEAGLDWYEISNWARPGHECTHNRLYWDTTRLPHLEGHILFFRSRQLLRKGGNFLFGSRANLQCRINCKRVQRQRHDNQHEQECHGDSEINHRDAQPARRQVGENSRGWGCPGDIFREWIV